MKKFVIYCFLLIICSLMLIAPIRNPFKKKRLKLYPPLTKEEISGVTLWKRITEEENYKDYPFWPGHEGTRPGQFPHGSFHKVFIHPYLRDALPIKERIAPNGSIVVKCNLGVDEDILEFTIMAKVKGYSPESNDWFWAKISQDGEIKAAGKLQGCIDCHVALSDNDYLLIHRLDREAK